MNIFSAALCLVANCYRVASNLVNDFASGFFFFAANHTTLSYLHVLSSFQTSSSGGIWSQHEITVVTCQMSNTVLKQVERAMKDIDAENLKV